MGFIADAKTAVNTNATSGAIGYAAGYGEGANVGVGVDDGTVTPNSKNVNNILVAGVSGVITMTTTATAGNGTLITSPYTGGTDAFGTGGAALVAAVAATPLPTPTTVIKWRCKAVGAIGYGTAGTLQSRYAPGECR
jgi:type IV pilus assembly protein PilA